MRIRMLVGLSGNAYSLGPGDEHDFPNDEALRLIAAEFAIPVAEIEVERAVAEPVTEKRGRRGKNVVSADSDGGRN